MYTGCSRKDISKVLKEYYGNNSAVWIDSSSVRFSSDGTSMRVTVSKFDVSNGLSALAYFTISLTPHLDYLALGDSYTSGEGDVGKKSNGDSYYIKGTQYGGSCHLSTRSYPFLLREKWGISQDKMKSVACSGAKVLPDYYGNENTYVGQSNHLATLSESARATEQQKALDDFTPGEVQQIEFVKKYQPKIITLTGGGNDVGFAGMLSYCAYGSGNPSTKWETVKEGVFGLATCAYAMSNSTVQQITLRAIDDQYAYTVELLKRIKSASPYSKVYVVGYPSFITVSTTHCPNSLELDGFERATIQYFLELLNDKLKQAADNQGVTFVDIEDSLYGGRICEGGAYMTGIANVNVSDASDMSGLFHPNAEGHKKIADAIQEKLPSVTSARPQANKPSSIGELYDGLVRRMSLLPNALVTSTKLDISAPDGTFQPGTSVKITLFSDPIDLGEVKVSPGGGVETSVVNDYLPSGFHILTLEGVAPGGEKIIAYQSLTIDRDEKTIPLVATDNMKSGDVLSVPSEGRETEVPDGALGGQRILGASTATAIDSTADILEGSEYQSHEDSSVGDITLLLIIGLGTILVIKILYGRNSRN